MNNISFTLISEGSSDRALIPHLTWLLEQNGVGILYSEWADLSYVREKPKNLAEKIRVSFKLYPCDVLFIHRDTDQESIESRKNEIITAIYEAFDVLPFYVCVIPVRMLEAWLLFDTKAIRRAVGNPNGNVELNLPKLNRIEQILDPKQLLNEKLKEASELSGRHLKRLNISHSVSQISQYIEDFSPLRELNAFVTLENDIKSFIDNLNIK